MPTTHCRRPSRNHNTLRRIGIAACGAGLGVAAGCISALPPTDGGTPVAGTQAAKGTQTFSLKAANYQRSYVLHTPPSFAIGVPQPVVLLLHGSAGDGLSFLNDNGWAAKADGEG